MLGIDLEQALPRIDGLGAVLDLVGVQKAELLQRVGDFEVDLPLDVRGQKGLHAPVELLVDGGPQACARLVCRFAMDLAIRKAREAALADPEGKALGSTLGKPVVWLKPVKSKTHG